MSKQYEDELLEIKREFDPDTGEETPESQELQAELLKDQLIAEAEMLVQMCQTQGWKLVRSALLLAIDQNCSDLIESSEIDTIRRCQERIKANQAILALVDDKIAAGRQAAEEKTSTRL